VLCVQRKVSNCQPHTHTRTHTEKRVGTSTT
jgi:hypothetical protein